MVSVLTPKCFEISSTDSHRSSMMTFLSGKELADFYRLNHNKVGMQKKFWIFLDCTKIEIIKMKKASLKGLKEIVDYLNKRFEDDLRYFQERQNEVASLLRGNQGNAVEYVTQRLTLPDAPKFTRHCFRRNTRIYSVFFLLFNRPPNLGSKSRY